LACWGLQLVTYEEAIELRLAAGELVDGVCALQFLDTQRRRHG